MDIQTIFSAIEGWFYLLLIWNLVLTVILIVFLVGVPKALNEIAHYMRQIYLYGPGAHPNHRDPLDDDIDE